MAKYDNKWNRKYLGVWIDEEIILALKSEAEQLEISTGSFVRKILREWHAQKVHTIPSDSCPTQ